MQIELRILSGRDIHHNKSSSINPFVQFQLNNNIYKTNPFKSVNPVWSKSFYFVSEPNTNIMLYIYNHSLLLSNNLIGKTLINIPFMNTKEILYKVLPLNVKGVIYVSITCHQGFSNTLFKELDVEKQMILEISEIKIRNVMKNITEKFNVNMKESVMYSLSLDSPSIKSQTTIISKKEKYKGNQCDWDEKYLIPCEISKLIIPDYIENEQHIIRLQFNNYGYIQFKIKCIESIYHNFDYELLPNPIQNTDYGKMMYQIHFEKMNCKHSFKNVFIQVTANDQIVKLYPNKLEYNTLYFDAYFIMYVKVGDIMRVQIIEQTLKKISTVGIFEKVMVLQSTENLNQYRDYFKFDSSSLDYTIKRIRFMSPTLFSLLPNENI
ncbi:C2 domain-containing protein [Entamoeba marina]